MLYLRVGTMFFIFIFIAHLLSAQNVGIGVAEPLSKLHVNGGILAEGSGATPVLGNGSRLLWIPDKAAFRVGTINTPDWAADSIGTNSFGAGANTKAKGHTSIALGGGAHATGTFSVGIGNLVRALGNNSFAAGTGTLATALFSLAIGNSSAATNQYAISVGNSSDASGKFAMCFGLTTRAKGFASTTMGLFNDNSDSPNPVVPVEWDRIFQFGCGADESNRKNAITILRNANVGIGALLPHAILHIQEGESGAADPGFPGLLIERNGNTYVTFSTPTASESGIIFGNPAHNAHGGIIYNNTTFPQDANGLQFRTNTNTTRMVIYANGNAWLQGTLTQNSDERLKKDIRPIENATAQLRQLTGYHYLWKAEDVSPTRQTGFLAQEVQQVFPELVTESGGGHLGVNYTGMIPYLLEALKEQQLQIELMMLEIMNLKKQMGN